jgi:hypothetical protein
VTCFDVKTVPRSEESVRDGMGTQVGAPTPDAEGRDPFEAGAGSAGRSYGFTRLLEVCDAGRAGWATSLIQENGPDE